MVLANVVTVTVINNHILTLCLVYIKIIFIIITGLL